MVAFIIKYKRLAVLLLVSVLFYTLVQYIERKHNFCGLSGIAMSSYFIYAIWAYLVGDVGNISDLSKKRLSICIQGISLAFIEMTIAIYVCYLATYQYAQYTIDMILVIERWEYYFTLGCAISLISIIFEWKQTYQCSPVIIISNRYDTMNNTTVSMVAWIILAFQCVALLVSVLYDEDIGIIVIAGFLITDVIYKRIICLVRALHVSIITLTPQLDGQPYRNPGVDKIAVF